MLTNGVVVPANCDDDIPSPESCINSKLELNGDHQACQYEKDPVYRSEHTRVVHLKVSYFDPFSGILCQSFPFVN